MKGKKTYEHQLRTSIEKRIESYLRRETNLNPLKIDGFMNLVRDINKNRMKKNSDGPQFIIDIHENETPTLIHAYINNQFENIKTKNRKSHLIRKG